MSDQPESRLQELTRDQCLDLLESHLFLGRIGYVVDGLPIIVPVNFVVDGESVVYSTAKGSKLSWLSNHSRVAFQADHGRPADRSGWSVLIHGTAREVTDPAELEALRAGSLRSWAFPAADHWVRISIDHISGRRIERGVRRVATSRWRRGTPAHTTTS
jgi:uncharacterized protein